MRRFLPILCAATVGAAAVPAEAQMRAESSVPGRLAVRNSCPMTDLAAIAKEQQEVEAAFLAPILASLGGELAKSALGGIANAIDAASKEHAYTASGSDGFFLGGVDRGSEGSWGFSRNSKCLIFWVPSGKAKAGGLADFSQEAVRHGIIDESKLSDLVATELPGIGLMSAPAVYIEIALVPNAEAQVLRPTLVWYREPIGRAGNSARRSEIAVSLASPSYGKDVDAIGSIFALSRIELPRIAPGEVFRTDELTGLGTTYHPHRPTTGAVDNAVSSRNSADAALVTATVAETAAKRVYDAAMLKAKASGKAEDAAAALVAQHALEDAMAARTAAATKVSIQKPVTGIGATNARVSFMVIRDANKFGLAIASAVGAQKEALGTAVTTALTPQPDWAAGDTTMLNASLDVQAKQNAYDAAVAEGDATKILTARNALLLAKAKANEAAAATNRPLPYPDLLAQVGG